MVTGETRAGEMEEAYQTESATRRATVAPYRPLRYHTLPPEVAVPKVRSGMDASCSSCWLLLQWLDLQCSCLIDFHRDYSDGRRAPSSVCG